MQNLRIYRVRFLFVCASLLPWSDFLGGALKAQSPAPATSIAAGASTHAPVAPAQPRTLGADGQIVESDNLYPPYLAVYRWDTPGMQRGELDTYAAWLNRTEVWPESHQPKETWDHVEGGKWQLGPWGKWISEHPRARFIYSVSILVGKWDLSGPATGPEANVPLSLVEGATGKYNDHFKVLAEHLVANGFDHAILRLGWEFNGGWMPWHVTNQAQAEAFIGYWKQIVTTMRAVPGAENLQFCWNPNAGPQTYPWDKIYPGDDYVDNIGIDLYDDCYQKDTYPWPDNATADEIDARRKKAWDFYYKGPSGLVAFQKFGQQHHKTLSFPEWGVNKKPDKHGGLDNPYFIEQMSKFIHDPASNVLFSCYFDINANDGGHLLAPNLKGQQTIFPLSAEAFRKAFTNPGPHVTPLPAGTPATNVRPANSR